MENSFPNFIRAVGGHLDSERIEKQFGHADIYYITQVIMNSYRIPDSSSKGKDSPREGKGARWEGQRREANLADGGDQTGGDDNYQPQGSFESREVVSIKISGVGKAMDVRYTAEGAESLIDLDWGELGHYGTDIGVGYLENRDGACDYEDTNNKTDIEAVKVFANDNITRERQGGNNDPLTNFGGKCIGGSGK